MTSPLWAVLPGSIDDPAAPSGGNRYDRTVLPLLRRPVRELLADGSWPSPTASSRAALDAALSGIPEMSDVLIDGLVACGVPEVLEPYAGRLRLAILVHLPLSDETGLTPAEAGRLRASERRALHLATTVIATSEQAARHIAAMHDLPKVFVAAPGVDRAPLAVPSDGGGRLLCVASVRRRKGQDLLVRVLEERLSGEAWTSCTFAGAVGDAVPYSDFRLRFAGPLAGEALDAVYADADLFVLPSRAETYGMVITEALARGLPVVATEVGGVPEAMGFAPGGERPGTLIPPDDPDALADAIRRWLTDPDLRQTWRAAAAGRRATLPQWSETARRLDEILGGEHP